ncbi:hypothetical protein, partial [Alcanivorax jadensis]|uniref:hypothetical protein n=1 Tax=Alcanivorax jadensis TaxID=64988 RepID=UPI00356814AC
LCQNGSRLKRRSYRKQTGKSATPHPEQHYHKEQVMLFSPTAAAPEGRRPISHKLGLKKSFTFPILAGLQVSLFM